MSESVQHEDDAPKQAAAMRYVLEALQPKRNTGSFSVGFILELAQHVIRRGYDVHRVFDEIAVLEGVSRRRSATKPAEQFDGKLAGYWHKHHFQDAFTAHNVLNEMKQAGTVRAAFLRHIGKTIEEAADQMAYDVVVGGFMARRGRQALTGEWIVFEKLPDGSNRYLTLGHHREGDDAILARLVAYRKWDEQVREARKAGSINASA